jgi:hypothetical protein
VKRLSWSRSKSSTARSIRLCDGAHIRGGDPPVMGADAAVDRTQRHLTGQAVGDEHTTGTKTERVLIGGCQAFVSCRHGDYCPDSQMHMLSNARLFLDPVHQGFQGRQEFYIK